MSRMLMALSKNYIKLKDRKLQQSVIYKNSMWVRFADLDPYGHVNSSLYLDYVASSRLKFLEQDLKYPLSKVSKQGVGWYMKRSDVNYRLPIEGLLEIQIRSWVAKVDGSTLHVHFAIESADGSSVYADGALEFVVVDLKTKKRTPMPDWMNTLFFTSVAE